MGLKFPLTIAVSAVCIENDRKLIPIFYFSGSRKAERIPRIMERLSFG